MVVDLLDRKLLFVTGKGGVGKTSIASALAVLAASHGRRSLVCEVDAKGDLASAFETEPLRFKPREVHDGVFAMAMDTEQSLREYLKLQLRIPLVGRIGPLARSLDFVASAAPGVKEILTVGKFCYEVRQASYDLVVVDAEASGHIVAQLTAPDTIARLVQVGVVREQTQWMLDILNDPGAHGRRHRDEPRRDARERDDRAGGPPARADVGRSRRGGREPGAARAVRPR